MRARWLAVGTGRWLSEDPLRFGADDFNLYRYVGNEPVARRDPSGLKCHYVPGACRNRTAEYCAAAKKTGLWFDNCACRVSAMVCNIITIHDFTKGMRMCMDCLNKCMFHHWVNRDITEWQQANRICSRCKGEPAKCCDAMVVAEQTGLSLCKKSVCNTVCSGKGKSFPPSGGSLKMRIHFGQDLCCVPKKGGLPGGPL